MDEVEAEKNSEKSCFYAQERYKTILLWRNLWSILLFVFGATVIILIILLLYMAMKQASVEFVLSVLATVTDSLAIKWVLARRKESVEEEEKAFEVIKKECPDKRSLDIDLFKKQLTLFGKFR